MSSNVEFGKVRSIFWPIHLKELYKFIPMSLIFFLITFNYNLLRAIKDTLIVTAPSSGAEAIPFIKLWAILPMALFMTYIFTKLSSKHSKEKVFNYMMSIFVGFFILFTFVLYPLRDYITPQHLADNVQANLPLGLNGFIAMIRNWPLTLFYVMSELWGSAILTVLFWGFANEVTSVQEAKRFYPLLGVGANISGILSGQTAVLFCSNKFFSFIHYGSNAWEQSVLFLNSIVIFFSFIVMLIFRYLNKKTQSIEGISSTQYTVKEKISLKESFKYLAKSKYLICIALIVLSYNLTTHIAEVLWKNQIKLLHPNPSEFSAYMGKVMTMIGLIATVIAMISGNILRKRSWSFNALITPIVVLVSGVLFFSYFILKSSPVMTNLAGFFSSTPLILSVLFGTIQNTVSRASKYTLFDSTKEIAFIPLSKESKRKGKAAIDGVGSRFGKSFGSTVITAFLIMFSTLTASAPYIGLLFIVILGVWLVAAVSLGKQFNALSSNDTTINIQATNSKDSVMVKNNEGLKSHYPFVKLKKKDKIEN